MISASAVRINSVKVLSIGTMELLSIKFQTVQNFSDAAE